MERNQQFYKMVQDIRLIAEEKHRQYAFVLREQKSGTISFGTISKNIDEIIHQGNGFSELHYYNVEHKEDVGTVIALVRKQVENCKSHRVQGGYPRIFFSLDGYY